MENGSSVAGARDDYDDEIDLRELFAVLWGGKKTILSIVFLSGLFSALVALYLPNNTRPRHCWPRVRMVRQGVRWPKWHLNSAGSPAWRV